MSGHSITKCKECKVIMSQCRCIKHDKKIIWSICDKCKKKGD